MKKFEKLTKNEMKSVKGGGALACSPVGAPCTGNVQCCSNVCLTGQGGPTGARCVSAK
ncbi:bacteriocin-like protein [Mucilaginibacter pineti]|nr:bacteriocin [Mucilaginibacter pineti]